FTGGYGGPYNKLTLDAKGNIYGFTNAEGANGLGSVFKLTPSNGGWTFTDLYDFIGGTKGASPYGSVAVDTDGHVFGTAAVGGRKIAAGTRRSGWKWGPAKAATIKKRARGRFQTAEMREAPTLRRTTRAIPDTVPQRQNARAGSGRTNP